MRPELVVEVRYDKVQGNRFRHGTKFIRWRADKDPKDCTWRELRPARDPNAPDVEALFGVMDVPPERDAYGQMMLARSRARRACPRSWSATTGSSTRA